MQTATHRQTVCCQAVRFIDPQAPLWGHIRPGCCPLSPSLLSSLTLSTPFHHHLIICSEKEGYLYTTAACTFMRESMSKCVNAWGFSVRGAVCFNCPSPYFGVSGCVSLAKSNKNANYRGLRPISLWGLDSLLLIGRSEASQHLHWERQHWRREEVNGVSCSYAPTHVPTS